MASTGAWIADHVLADGRSAPEGVAALVAEPLEGPLRGGLESAQPFLAPARPESLRVGGQGVLADHLDGPVHALPDMEGAADVVDVEVVAVVAEMDRDDRPKSRRLAGSCLERGEPAPADPEHADAARAPAARRQPVDHRQVVGDLALRVLALDDAFRAARAPHVQATARVARRRERPVERPVAGQRPVVLPVRDGFEQGGERAVAEREVERRGEANPIVHRDPHVLRPHGEADRLARGSVAANAVVGLRTLRHAEPPRPARAPPPGRADPSPAP